LIIEIVAIGKVPTKLLHALAPALEKAFSPFIDGCIIGPPLKMPPAAYNSSRGQYDARLIIGRLLRHITGENRVLAWTDVDLYVPDKNFVFGLAQYLGRAALVSLKRLNPTFYSMSPNYRLMLERATKESVHELGHVFGLEHCSNKTCVMSFSNSIFEVDKKAATFCKRCQSFLHLRQT
jgi:archaemetzincin